jgi:hypothetical protein
MKERSDRVPLLVRWNVGWDEVDTPKLETFLCSSRYSEVPVVNGIKGSAEESDVHNLFNSQSLCCVRPPCIS